VKLFKCARIRVKLFKCARIRVKLFKCARIRVKIARAHVMMMAKRTNLFIVLSCHVASVLGFSNILAAKKKGSSDRRGSEGKLLGPKRIHQTTVQSMGYGHCVL